MAVPALMPAEQPARVSNSRDEAMFYESAPFYTCRLVLQADTSDDIAVPSGATKVRFSTTDNFYARPNQAVPQLSNGNVEDGTAGELNPARWNLRSAGADGAVTSIYLRAALADTEVSLAFFRD